VVAATEAEFNDRKRQLHALYKRYKTGLIGEEDLTDEQRFLLTKYYGVKEKEDVLDDDEA
jgi:hypothetical protein